MFEAMGVPEGEQIEHKMLSNAIEKAQMKIEGNNYGIREQLLKFDEVNNEQREVIYKERRKVLDGDNMRDLVLKMITDIVENAVDMSVSDEDTAEKWDLTELNNLLLPIIPLKSVVLTDEQKKSMKKNELKHTLKEAAIRLYETKEAEFPEPEQIREIERVVLLKVIDNKWMSHLDDMDALREGIGLQAYGQRDPVVEYKMQGYELYEAMMAAIQEETVRILFHIRVEQKIERESAAKVTGTNKDATPIAPKKRDEQKIYPNDPCPCGSGKKYKQCCGRFAE
jgi:preprotein translocase subunit SecA